MNFAVVSYIIKSMKHRTVTAAFLSLVIVLGFALSGCGCNSVFGGKVKSIGFTDELIQLEVGQTKEITASMVTVGPKFANDKSFYIVSENESIVSVSGSRTIKGESFGSVRLKVYAEANENIYGETVVKVDYSSNVTMTLTPYAPLVSAGGIVIASSAESTPVELVCTLSEGADPSIQADWSVNGKSVYSGGLSYIYDTPREAGVYEVECAVDTGLKQTVSVRVFDEFVTAPAGAFTGAILQDGAYSDVAFTPEAALPGDNPPPVADWYVNGAYAGSGYYVFRPQGAGEYTVTLKVNGVSVLIDGAESVTIRATGTVVPSGITIDYDNCYPDVYVRWSDPGVALDYEVKIGSRSYRSTNSAYRSLFDGASFNAAGKLDIFAGATVSVKSLGNGDLFKESEYGTAYTLAAIPSAAEKYLADKFYDGARNYYMTDAAEFNEAYAEMLLFRRGASTVSMNAYIAYAANQSPVEMARNASKMSHFTGSYYISAESEYTVVKAGSTISVSVRCDTVNAPSMRTGAGGSNDRNAALNAIRPHINYDETAARPAGYRFPIDYIEESVIVNTSEELYYTAEHGFRPVPEKGSAAETMYNFARTVLRAIVTDDMTDAEKAHAVYDYIMWKVVYDNEVVEITSLSQSVKYEAYYLEGVFSTAAPFAVCDGMSKAYSLMCNIEGLPCRRISGTANAGGTWGGHAWNKVQIEGKWYNVDCTWGDYRMGIRNDKGQVVYKEMASHAYLFLTDAEMKADHKEDSPNNYPVSTSEAYNWYNRKIPYDGSNVDFYIMTVGSALTEEINRLVDYALSIKPNGRTFQVGDSITTSAYFGVELKISANVADYADSRIGTLIAARLAEKRQGGRYISLPANTGLILLNL